MIVEMPVCEHSIPIRLPCDKCGRKGTQDKPRNEPIHEGIIIKFEKKVSSLKNDVKKMVKAHENQYEYFHHQFKVLFKEVADLKARVQHLEAVLRCVNEIESKAERAIQIFTMKAHDLKKIDSKRDDVINILCQKITEVERRIQGE